MITMYYDDTCSICCTEAYHLASDKITIIAIKQGLDELNKHGIDELTAMTYLCVLDDDNKMHIGIHAVRFIHQTADSQFNKLLHFPIIKQISAIIYPIFAKYRHKIPTWFIIRLFGDVINTPQYQCHDNVCHISPKKRLKHQNKTP